MASLLAPEPYTGTCTPPDHSPVIRAALPEDQPQIWRLQQEAFSLPESGAPPHPGTHDEFRVVAQGGEIRSCLTLIHAELCLRGARVPMGGIRHVATHPDAQNQGHASALLRDTLQHLRGQRVPTSVLFPFSFRYYRKFGYELGGNHVQFWCRPNCIPAYVERRLCRAAMREDAAALTRFHQDLGSRSACGMRRDERRWSYLLADNELQVVWCGADMPQGYAITTEARDAYGGRILRVLELETGSPTAWRGLLGYLAQTPAESVEWLARASDIHASGLMRTPAPLREGFKPRGVATVRPLFQFRVVHLEEAVRARLSTCEPGGYRLALRVTDDLLPDNSHPLCICADGHRVSLRDASPSDPCLEADIRIFSQIYCGYMSPAEAVSQDLARCSNSEALDIAERLFPPGEPFLSELDRF